MIIKIPGLHGLGECVMCGAYFGVQVWLGENICWEAVDGFDVQLPMHQKCSKNFRELIGKSWIELPEGPLRREFSSSYTPEIFE